MKWIAIVLATCAAMFIILLFFGGSLFNTAFHITSLGWNVSWFMVVGGVVGFTMYKVIKGK
jgi:hypothetical protein